MDRSVEPTTLGHTADKQQRAFFFFFRNRTKGAVLLIPSSSSFMSQSHRITTHASRPLIFHSTSVEQPPLISNNSPTYLVRIAHHTISPSVTQAMGTRCTMTIPTQHTYLTWVRTHANGPATSPKFPPRAGPSHLVPPSAVVISMAMSTRHHAFAAKEAWVTPPQPSIAAHSRYAIPRQE